MAINTEQSLAVSARFANSIRQAIRSDLVVVCLLSALGLALSALAIALGFGAEISQAFSIIG